MTHQIEVRIKEIMVESLNLDSEVVKEIQMDTPLFTSGIGLDSIDVLELIVNIEKSFNIKIENSEQAKTALRTVGSLVAFIEEKKQHP